ncbi:Phosphatidylinositol-4-phosphate 5-kinase [Tulasnella sp. 403]|nr:Phosphatidylinositol-4-phosphate 5-kinase [Tulasnella sp. 403]
MATTAGPMVPPPTSGMNRSTSRQTSIMSNSVASFQTAPLASSTSASSSRDSFVSQNTIGVTDSSRPIRGAQDVSSFVPSAVTTSVGYPTPAAVEKASDLDQYQGHKLANGKSIPAGIATHRLEPVQQTYYTPPSPPPSVSPSDERNFDAFPGPDADPPVLVETPQAMVPIDLPSSSKQIGSPANVHLGESRMQAKRSDTVPSVPLSDLKAGYEGTASMSSGASTSSAPYTRVTRASEDAASVSTVTVPAKAAPVSQDPSLLHPPAPAPPRPTRRNTTGSTTRPPRNAQNHMSVQLSGPGGPSHGFPSNGSSAELDSDIQKAAEQIRAERRAKAQQEAEAAAVAPRRGKSGSIDEDKPLVGKIIGEDHVNYVLMYNMLTGIRVAVSRCQAKIKRPLTDEDYTASHKYSFDIVGNELTPSAKYDFKFKDYAPSVFRELREDHFRLDPSDYLVSLTAKYILSELGSPGKSGSFFYFSRDYRFIIKTLHHAEHKFLRNVLKQYHDHMQNNPHSLLSRFYGLHRVKLPHGRKIHFVIMNNLFPPHRDIHETYDLKGSTVGREYPEERAAQNPRAVLKDLNWIHRARTLELGPEKRAYLTEQIRRDTEFLKAINVMDYSLLIGTHNMQRGNRDNLRRNTLKVFSPAVPTRRPTSSQVTSRSEASAIRRAMRQSDPKALGTSSHAILPDEDPEDKQAFIFYQDEGGFRSTDESNQPMDALYYLGIIDICTPWTAKKRIENIWKGFKNDRHKISPVPSTEYGERFFAFMQAIMRGGKGGDAFLEKPAGKEKVE